MRPPRHAALALACCALLTGAPAAGELRDADELLEGCAAAPGLFVVHRDEHRVFLEVPSGQLEQPFLLATSVAGGPTYTGFQWRDMVCVWRRVGEKLLLVEREVRYRVQNRRQPMSSAVQRTYTDRVLHAAPILAERGGSPVIDLAAVFGGAAETFFGPVAAQLDGEVVLVESAKAFPKNVAFTLTVPDGARGGRLTSLAYSLSWIPEPGSDRYRPRAADDRVGTFLTAIKDFSDETAGGDRFVRFVHRWQLEKADPRLERSPVADPIVFYIERTVPFRFRQAVREGILAWNEAFAAFGLQNALVVRQQTEREFTDLDPADVRYNFFRWIVSERAFAMGPSRVNPWTGQILDADIVFDESMVRAYLREYDVALRRAPRQFFSPEVQRWLDTDPQRFWFARALPGDPVAPAGTPPAAITCELGSGVAHQLAVGLLAAGVAGDVFRKGPDAFPQEFIDGIVKDVVMHEVGHTLGLRHNFKASTYRPLEAINGAERPGDVCASVMDYNPINVRKAAGEVQGNYTMTTLGPYDRWAIRYAYDPDEEAAREATVASVTSRQYAYATDEDTWGPDPYAARWDLGRDPLVFARDRMDLASSLWSGVVERVVEEGQPYDRARRAFDMLLYDYLSASLAAARFVGGQAVHRYHRGDADAPPPLAPIPAAKQREALALVCERVLAGGPFDLSPALLRQLAKGNWSHWGSRDGAAAHSYPFHERVLGVQAWALTSLVNPGTLARLLDTESKVDADADLLTVPELIGRVSAAVFGPVLGAEWRGAGTARRPLIPTLQRNLQRHYVGELIAITLERGDGPTPAAAQAVVRLEARARSLALSTLSPVAAPLGILPLADRNNAGSGLLCLLYAGEDATTEPSTEHIGFVQALSGFSAVSMESRQLLKMQKNGRKPIKKRTFYMLKWDWQSS